MDVRNVHNLADAMAQQLWFDKNRNFREQFISYTFYRTQEAATQL